MSHLEDLLADRLEQNGVNHIREFRFHPKRKWRFDFLLPESNIVIEVEGGVWTRGRHTRGTGFISDCDKYNEATIAGFKVLRLTSSHFTKMKIHDTMNLILNFHEKCKDI